MFSITAEYLFSACMASLRYAIHITYGYSLNAVIERDAMGDDEYHPISRKGTNLTEAGGIGYTVVDSIDTMLIMGLNDEYARARNWVATKMFLEQNANFNTFEVHPGLPGM